MLRKFSSVKQFVDENIDGYISDHLDANLAGRISDHLDANFNARADTHLAANVDGHISNHLDANLDARLPKLQNYQARSNSTVYQAANDGYIFALADNTANYMEIFVDSDSTPSTVRNGGRTENTGQPNGSCVPVKAGDYYKVTGSNAAYWIEWS